MTKCTFRCVGELKILFIISFTSTLLNQGDKKYILSFEKLCDLQDRKMTLFMVGRLFLSAVRYLYKITSTFFK